MGTESPEARKKKQFARVVRGSIVIVSAVLLLAFFVPVLTSMGPDAGISRAYHESSGDTLSRIDFAVSISGTEEPILDFTLDKMTIELPPDSSQCPDSVVVALQDSLLVESDRSFNYLDTPVFSTSLFTLDPSLQDWSSGDFLHYADSSSGGIGLEFTTLPFADQHCETERTSALVLEYSGINSQRGGWHNQRIGTAEASTIRPYYYYPFDEYWMPVSAGYMQSESPSFRQHYIADKLGMQVGYQAEPGDMTLPSLGFTFNSLTWYARVVDKASYAFDAPYPTIILERPIASRFLTASILIVLFVAIVLILRIREFSDLVQVIVALVISMWGIRALIVPADMQVKMGIDDVLLLYYLLIATMVLLRIFVVPLWQRFGKEQ